MEFLPRRLWYRAKKNYIDEILRKGIRPPKMMLNDYKISLHYKDFVFWVQYASLEPELNCSRS